MLTLAQLLQRHGQPQHGAPYAQSAIEQQLSVIPEWQCKDGALQRSYSFKNYYETIAFVNALAFMVHHEDHHPDLQVGYNRCEVRFNTHSIGGISENDFISAAKAEAIYKLQFTATN